MAKANLPVNFKDDILKENMNGKRRFNMIQNSDGTVSFEDVTEYTQVGSTFGAAQINATNEAVNNAADASKIIDSLDTIKANTKSGYIAGALAVKALSSNLGNKPDFAYSPVYTGNYNNDSHTITVEKNKYYMAVFKDANGAGRCNISKLSINNATIEKSMGDSTNNFCIFWFKANSNSITISGTKTAVATFFVSELSNDHAYCKNFTSITYVPKGYDYQTYTVPCTKYAMIISMGYQGSQSLSIAVDAESYRQNSFKNIKSYATHSGYHNSGYAHLICESNDNFNVILIKANNILVYLS